MRFIDRQALDAQTSAKQPPWLLLIAVYLAALRGPHAIWFVALKAFPSSGVWLETHPAVVGIVWFSLHLLAAYVGVFVLLAKFRESFFGRSGFRARSVAGLVAISIVCSLPLSVFYAASFAKIVRGLTPLIAYASSPASEVREDALRHLAEVHVKVWTPLGWGTHTLGMILATLTSLIISPVYEQCFVVGAALTRLARLLKLRFAIPAAAALFVLTHLGLGGERFAANWHLFLLMALSAIAARLWSGCWLAGALTHAIVNSMIFLPKWWFAFAIDYV